MDLSTPPPPAADVPPGSIFLFSIPRATSNLLTRRLNLYNQPGIVTQHDYGGYNFVNVAKVMKNEDLFDKPCDTWTGPQYVAVKDQLRQGYRYLRETCSFALSEGKPVFVKEHLPTIIEPRIFDAYVRGHDPPPDHLLIPPMGTEDGIRSARNPTILTDNLLRQFKPVFVIRHPIVLFPAILRTSHLGLGRNLLDAPRGGIFKLYHFMRQLFSLYARFATEANVPIEQCIVVIDADDYMEHPDLVDTLAQHLGLDTSMLVREWGSVSSELQRANPEMHDLLHETLMASSNVEKNKMAAGLMMPVEKAKWAEEFGVEQAERLAELAVEAMHDYWYLRGTNTIGKPRQE